MSHAARAVSSGAPTRSVWVTRAVWLAAATVAYNLIEGVVAIAFGVGEESVALFGFGADSFIEVASAMLVLWRLRGEHGLGPGVRRERERRASLGIGALFTLLAAGVIAGASLQLRAGGHPETTVPGIAIAGLSLSFMFFLWAAKRRAATELDSATVAADAACSRACIQLSAVLLAGSVVFAVAPSLWWADAAAALVLAAFIAREGIEMVRAARRPDFSGGCGCSG